MRRTLPGLALGWLLASTLAAAEPAPAALRRAIEPIVSRQELLPAFWGIEVRSLDSGKTLYALNAERAFQPASTLKLATTAAALLVFGPEARLRTTVETAARLDGQGRILGDVFLVGRGDPNLSARSSPGRPTAAFEALADALAAAGVHRIEGRLVGYEGLFGGERRGHDWTWEDLVWGYGAPVSALSFNDNGVELQLRAGEQSGDPAVLEVAPRSPLVTVVSTVTSAEAGVPQDVRLEKDGATTRLSGRLPLGGRWSGRIAVDDPALFATTAFSAVLEARGVALVGGALASRAPLPPGLRVLAAHDGLPMGEMIRIVNKESLNLHAEMLLRLLGLRLKGEGSAEKGAEAVVETLAGLGVSTVGWQLSDGCGLARSDLVTPRGLADLLAAMDRHPLAAAFRDSLPVAGVDGTLETRLRGTPAERRIVAKTGTLALASALAGYATTRRGERLAFVIMLNNHPGKAREAAAAIDAMAESLVR